MIYYGESSSYLNNYWIMAAVKNLDKKSRLVEQNLKKTNHLSYIYNLAFAKF